MQSLNDNFYTMKETKSIDNGKIKFLGDTYLWNLNLIIRR